MTQIVSMMTYDYKVDTKLKHNLLYCLNILRMTCECKIAIPNAILYCNTNCLTMLYIVENIEL